MRSHLQQFLTLTMQAINAEFPTFDLLAAFSVFRIDSQARRKTERVMDASWRERCFQRLAQTFRLDEQRLLEQFSEVRPMAAHEALSLQEEGAWGAWQKAVQRIGSRRSARDRVPVETLSKLLCYYGSWNGLCTSGVEQSFSTMARVIPAERRHMSDDLLADELQLHFDRKTSGDAALCAGAILVWRCCFGTPRKSCFDQVRVTKV